MATESNSPSPHSDGTTSSHRFSLPTEIPGTGIETPDIGGLDTTTPEIEIPEELQRASARARRVANAFVYSAGFIATVAAAETVIATVLLGIHLTLAPVVVGLITFAVYATDRVADAETDAASNPGQASYARRHGSRLSLAAALAYGLAVTLSLLGGPIALGLTLLPGAFWVLYASDWLPSVGTALPGLGGRLPRLKDVLLVNSAVVAFAWAVALTFIPIAFAAGAMSTGAASSGAGTAAVGVAANVAATGGILAELVLSPAVAIVFAYFFCRSFVDVEVPNVRDVEADRAIGVETLPTVLGVRRTRHALSAVDLGVGALLLLAAGFGLFAWLHVGALLAGLAVSLGVTAFVGRVENATLLGVGPECSYLAVLGVLVVVGL